MLVRGMESIELKPPTALPNRVFPAIYKLGLYGGEPLPKQKKVKPLPYEANQLDWFANLWQRQRELYAKRGLNHIRRGVPYELRILFGLLSHLRGKHLYGEKLSIELPQIRLWEWTAPVKWKGSKQKERNHQRVVEALGYITKWFGCQETKEGGHWQWLRVVKIPETMNPKETVVFHLSLGLMRRIDKGDGVVSVKPVMNFKFDWRVAMSHIHSYTLWKAYFIGLQCVRTMGKNNIKIKHLSKDGKLNRWHRYVPGFTKQELSRFIGYSETSTNPVVKYYRDLGLFELVKVRTNVGWDVESKWKVFWA